MNFGDLIVQGVCLEMACYRLDNVVEDIEKLKVNLEELLDDSNPELREGSRFRKLLSAKAMLNSMGIDAYSARREVKSALEYQKESFPQPEDLA
jgi:hypothetical protein